MVLGVILGHMLFLWWMTMYSHMKAYIHHPYSITHIGIGSWLGPYVVFMVTDHVPSYESIHPSSILHHAYWHWAMAWVICFFLLTDYVLTYLDHPYSITHIILYIYIGSWLGSCDVFMTWRIYHIYVYIYSQYPIPKRKIPHQKIPFLLKARHYFVPLSQIQPCSWRQSLTWSNDVEGVPWTEREINRQWLMGGSQAVFFVFGTHNRSHWISN